MNIFLIIGLLASYGVFGPEAKKQAYISLYIACAIIGAMILLFLVIIIGSSLIPQPLAECAPIFHGDPGCIN